MDWKLLLTVFGSVFVAELGDKTQLATMLFAAKNDASRWGVFLAASLALVVSTAVAVAAGALVSTFVGEKVLHWIAGVGFVVIGVWILWRA